VCNGYRTLSEFGWACQQPRVEKYENSFSVPRPYNTSTVISGRGHSNDPKRLAYYPFSEAQLTITVSME